MFPQTSSYRTQSITLPAANTAYSLSALLLAIDPKFPMQGREVTVCVDKLVAGTVRFGESNLSTTNCGFALTDVNNIRIFHSDKSDVPLNMVWAMGSVASMVVNVEVMQ